MPGAILSFETFGTDVGQGPLAQVRRSKVLLSGTSEAGGALTSAGRRCSNRSSQFLDIECV